MAIPDFGAYRFAEPARVVLRRCPTWPRRSRWTARSTPSGPGRATAASRISGGSLHLDVDEQFEPRKRGSRWPTTTSSTVSCSTWSTSSGNWSTPRSRSRCCAPTTAAGSVQRAATGGMPAVRAPSSSKGKSWRTPSGKHRVRKRGAAGRQTGGSTGHDRRVSAVPRAQAAAFRVRFLRLLRRPSGDRTKGRTFAPQHGYSRFESAHNGAQHGPGPTASVSRASGITFRRSP